MMPADTRWAKSTHSFANHNCVEVAARDGAVGVRDTTQDGAGPVLTFPDTKWVAFAAAVRRGELPA